MSAGAVASLPGVGDEFAERFDILGTQPFAGGEEPLIGQAFEQVAGIQVYRFRQSIGSFDERAELPYVDADDGVGIPLHAYGVGENPRLGTRGERLAQVVEMAAQVRDRGFFRVVRPDAEGEFFARDRVRRVQQEIAEQRPDARSHLKRQRNIVPKHAQRSKQAYGEPACRAGTRQPRHGVCAAFVTRGGRPGPTGR